MALVVALASMSACSKDRAPAEGATTIRSGGVDVAAIERGPSAAKARLTVLFLHGASYNSRIWDDRGILDAVAAKGYRAVAIDLPGSGGTKGLPDDADTGDWLRGLIDDLGGPEQVVLVSPSRSGEYSLIYLATHPDDPLAGFVAVAPVGIGGFGRPKSAADVPAVMVWGEDDNVIPRGQAHDLAEEFPGSTVEVIPDGSHAPYDDQPKAFTAVLLQFLDGLQG